MRNKYGYSCEVFPFFESHLVQRDSLQKGLVGMDSLFFLEMPKWYVQSKTVGVTYLQNIGLYFQNLLYPGGRMLGTDYAEINLLAYNNNKIFLDDTKNIPKHLKQSLQYQSKYERAVIFSHSIKLLSPAFTITGKRIGKTAAVPNGVIITTGK